MSPLNLLWILIAFGFAPGFVLRIILVLYPKGHPRRMELVAELYSRVPRVERPLWVAEQIEVAVNDGIKARLLQRAAGRQRAGSNAGAVDELTLLPNRLGSVELLNQLLAEPGGVRVTVVHSDLNDFGLVNSSLGRKAGDAALISLADRLRCGLPRGCFAARLSGDEFVVFCTDDSAFGGPEALAHRVEHLLRWAPPGDRRSVQLTASVGVARSEPTEAVSADDLMLAAELAMREGRRQRRCS